VVAAAGRIVDANTAPAAAFGAPSHPQLQQINI
jgi:hypothetical protein